MGAEDGAVLGVFGEADFDNVNVSGVSGVIGVICVISSRCFLFLF